MQKRRMMTQVAAQVTAITLVAMLQGACSHVNPLNQSLQTTTAYATDSDLTQYHARQNHSPMTSLKQRFSGTGILNGITPKQFAAHYNLAYGTDPRQRLDVYQPLPSTNTSANKSFSTSSHTQAKPVILFVHGGAWNSGSKDDYLFVGESFTKAGYVTVVMNYRLAPEHQYPDYVRDTALALKWINQHIGSYGGNPQQVVVMGHSAGAFNAIEAVDNQRWLAEVGVPVSSIKAVVGIAGPYSYDFRNDDTRTAFPAGVTPDSVMPDRHVRGDAPPHLLLIGSKDQRVKAINSQNLLRALQAKNIPAQLQVVEGANHISIMATVATRLDWYKDTRQQILDYLAKTLPR